MAEQKGMYRSYTCLTMFNEAEESYVGLHPLTEHRMGD
jgi:hypothetical protein